jgi:hypothetical protein
MNDLITIYYQGKEYWYYESDIFGWWDGELEGTWDQPMYASAVSDDGFYTIEWDEYGRIVSITNDFRS